MLKHTVENLLIDAFPGGKIEVHTDDNVHFSAGIHAPQFKGLSRVQQQQKVYAVLGALISSGELHAISLNTQVLEP